MDPVAGEVEDQPIGTTDLNGEELMVAFEVALLASEVVLAFEEVLALLMVLSGRV